MAESESIIVKKKRESVSATSSKIVDSIPLAELASLRYFISATGSIKAKALDFTVLNKAGLLEDTVFGRVGDLDIEVNANANMGNVEILITNNESFVIIVETFKFVSRP